MNIARKLPIETEFETIPNARFAFRLKASSDNTGPRSMENWGIVLTLKNGYISGGRLLNLSNQSERDILTVGRAEDSSRIILEDKEGFFRMILSKNDLKKEYELLVNHPSNRYHLDPMLN